MPNVVRLVPNLQLAIYCEIRPFAFSNELVYAVRDWNGASQVGVGNRGYFWDASGRIFARKQVTEPIRGLVAVLAVGTAEGDPDKVLVELPDSTIYWVRKKSLTRQPAGHDPVAAFFASTAGGVESEY